MASVPRVSRSDEMPGPEVLSYMPKSAVSVDTREAIDQLAAGVPAYWLVASGDGTESVQAVPRNSVRTEDKGRPIAVRSRANDRWITVTFRRLQSSRLVRKEYKEEHEIVKGLYWLSMRFQPMASRLDFAKRAKEAVAAIGSHSRAAAVAQAAAPLTLPQSSAPSRPRRSGRGRI